jgi:glucose/arabinose dehydrogenase
MDRRDLVRAWFSAATLVAFAATASSHAGVPADLQLQLVTSGLASPLTIRHANDGTGRLFIVEQAGRIRIWDQTTQTLLATPFLDIDPLVVSGGEQGLLGLAFHPDFASNGHFFVNYTRDASPLDRTVIARYEVSATDPNVADPLSAVVLMEIEQDFGNHNGGNILFGPDGYLYIGMGDGGSGGDPLNRAQNLGSLLGKMLRIDVDGTPPAEPNDLCGLSPNAYGIPPDNPYVDASGCDEIWSYGLRNPWRFSFDRDTGDLWIGDVGQGSLEEVDRQPATSTGGENWGWSCMEGTATPNYNPCVGATPILPVFEYSHALGCSITGGYMYRGPIASLRGTYIMGDYCSGRIWFGTGAGTSWTFTQWADTPYTISSFGEDEAGNVYLASLSGGEIYRFGLSAAGAGRIPDGTSGAPLRVDRAGTQITLTWGPSCLGSDTMYGVYEGLIGEWDGHKPRACTVAPTTYTFTPNPGNRFYLVVPRNAQREGSYGQNSAGLERPAGAISCIDQNIQGCP